MKLQRSLLTISLTLLNFCVELPSQRVDLFSCGTNDNGELAVFKAAVPGHRLRRLEERKFPYPIAQLQGVKIRMIASYGYINLVVTEEGRVLSWGGNDDGGLGRDTIEELGAVDSVDSEEEEVPNTPYSGVPTAIPGLQNIVKVSVGSAHGLALDSDGVVWAWGHFRSTEGAYGFDPSKSRSHTQQTPVKITTSRPVVDIASDANVAVLLLDDGDIYEFGNVSRGANVKTRDKRKHNLAVHVAVRKLAATAIWAGGYHVFFKSADGRVWAYGRNYSGQLGLGIPEKDADGAKLENGTRGVLPYLKQPVEVTAVRGKNVVQIACGDDHTIFRTDDGEVYTCGSAKDGRLGLGESAVNARAVGVPTLVNIVENGVPQRVVYVATGDHHSLFVAASGAAFVCGIGGEYRLGTGKDDDELVPVQVGGQRLQGRSVVLAEGGAFHSIFAAHKENDDG